ncbi:endonuclease/exonuclease/phosphatase family protein [Anaerolineales bacterium HSG25]|nr:endonuclease/exonuclease/phosphatase family protein [Anaerolineales bacterium HSG25]
MILHDLYDGNELHVDIRHDPGHHAIISRYPIQPVDEITRHKSTQKVILETPVGSILAWNFHPQHPIPSKRWPFHYTNICTLARDIRNEKNPLILAGDFNTTDQSEGYYIIQKYLKDVHKEIGYGLGFTFPAKKYSALLTPFPGINYSFWLVFPNHPFVRIDYIFYSQHFHPYSFRILPVATGSDHFPIVAEVSLLE